MHWPCVKLSGGKDHDSSHPADTDIFSGAVVAITFNFTLNNIFTYRDMRLRGFQWLRGWFPFTLACSVGAIANFGIASSLF